MKVYQQFSVLKTARALKSTEPDPVVRWVNVGLNLYSVFILAFFIRFLLWLQFPDGLGVIDLGLTITICIILCVTLASFSSVPFNIDHKISSLEQLSKEVRSKAIPSNDTECIELSARLDQLMLDKKPFLEPTITVKQLAANMDISSRRLSELINVVYGCRFAEYINRARVDEAKQLMGNAGQQELSLIDVAFEVGFNSKSSFNLMFKRFTGQTPSSYRMACRIANESNLHSDNEPSAKADPHRRLFS